MAFDLAPGDVLRAGLLVGVFVVLAGVEVLAPARPRALARSDRWLANGVLFAAAAGLQRLAAPGAVAGAALAAEHAGFGLFNQGAAPAWLAFALSIVVLDLALYLQHLAFHRVPLLWRVHAPHHADPELDVSTGLRFHPLELLVSVVWKAACVAVLGAPVAAVVAFEAALNVFSLVSHANVSVPARVERVLRWALITPALHRLHHDRAAGRKSGNFGFSTCLWDRLAGTFSARAEPAALGLEDLAPGAHRAGPSLLLPLTYPPVR